VEDLTKEFVAESREGLERMEVCLTELEQRHGDSELVGEIFRVVHTIKGTTGFLGFARLQTLAHAGESLLAALRDGRVQVTSELISGLLELRDGLQAIVEIIETRGSEGERRSDDDRELIAWMKELETGIAGRGAHSTPAAQSRDVGQSVPAHVAGAAENGVAKTSGTAEPDRTLRIEVEELDRMMNLVGDLVLTRNRMLQCQPGDSTYPEQVRRLNTVTAELRESVMRARMQPVGHIFAKFPRMVRDLAQRCGRKVRIEFEGQDTALDKSLLEAVRDPLTHAVRNAIDHGIEPEAERVRAGKPIEGVVRLKAYQQNGSVVIEVSDDGAGIATERVLGKAIERGLVTTEAAAMMTEREALQLIFIPGFSTAKEVTSVSGRGVGMDVVRAKVEEAGGRVEIESKAGKGTTLRLRVPLTLAIIPALVVECARQSFALPQAQLEELVYVPASEAASKIERMGSAELYPLRDRLLPLVRLGHVLQIEGSIPATRDLYIAVLEPEGRRFGLVVDGLRAPEEIVVKPLPTGLKDIEVYSGATVLSNGALAMILDTAAVAERGGFRAEAAEERNAEATRGSAGAEHEQTMIELESAMALYEGAQQQGDAFVRIAVPLSAVERIATVPLSDVEYAGTKPVLQYSGEVIPLEDEGDLLHELKGTVNAAATVLICRTGEGRRVGVTVRQVMDVCAGEFLPVDAAVSASPLARIKNRVTMVRNGFASALEGMT